MVTMFKPVRAPKEGRHHPGGLPFAGTGPRRLSQRQTLIVLILCLCAALGYFVYSSEAGIGASSLSGSTFEAAAKGAREVLQDDTPAAPAASIPELHSEKPLAEDKPANEFKPLGAPLTETYREPKHHPDIEDVKREKEQKPVVEETSVKPNKPKGFRPKTGAKSNLGPEKWVERVSFERALTQVVTMLPDEVHMRELIRPVEGTGKEKLREMGLRTRAYRKYFEAWEALHMDTDENGDTFVRDDVVQYLRSHKHIGEDELSDDGGLAGMNLAQTIRSYEAYRYFMVKFSQLLFPWTLPYFSDHMSLHAHFKKGGKGIVLTAGDDQAPYLLTTIPTFRKLGCDLPIEVMYLGEQDLGEDYRMELEALDGVVTRDIAQMVNDEGWKLAGWAAKPFAILLSSFREVIFIDADSLFFRNPALLFEDPDYQQTGALFFRDRLIMPENKKRWLQQILPKPIPRLAKQSRFWTGESGHMQESGVVVVDKWRHFIPMLLVTRMNGPDRDGNKEEGRIGVYDMVYGDKETFWVGWLLSGDESYAFHQGDAGIMGVVQTPEEAAKKKKKAGEEGQPPITSDSENHSDTPELDIDEAPANYTICAPQLLHLDLEGRPFWFNGWLLNNKFADKTKKKFANFESYLVEPRDVRDPGAWQLAEANKCCLTSDPDKKFDFDEHDREVLQMIMDKAHEVGMGDQRKR